MIAMRCILPHEKQADKPYCYCEICGGEIYDQNCAEEWHGQTVCEKCKEEIDNECI